MDKKAAAGYYEEPPILHGGPSSLQQSESFGTGVLPDPGKVPGEAPKYTEHAFDNVYIPPGGEEPPPDFTPYKAEFFISGKEIVSHDPHLNEDGTFTKPFSLNSTRLTTLKGEALYRFLLSQSATRPDYRMHLRGTHTESKSRTVTKTDSNGNTTHTTEHYTETVTGMTRNSTSLHFN